MKKVLILTNQDKSNINDLLTEVNIFGTKNGFNLYHSSYTILPPKSYLNIELLLNNFIDLLGNNLIVVIGKDVNLNYLKDIYKKNIFLIM